MSSFSSTTAWDKLISGASPAVALRQAALSAATRMSIQLGQRLLVSDVCVKQWSRAQLAVGVAQFGAEAVGVYLRLGDGLPGHAVLLASRDHALCAAACMLDEPFVEHAHLSELERSTLAELGNLAVASLMNTLALLTSVALLPPPPAALADSLRVVVDAITTSVVSADERLTVVVIDFASADHRLDVQLWLIPDRARKR